MRTTGMIFGVMKLEAEAEWRLFTRNGATATNTLSLTTANMTSGVYADIELFIVEYSTLSCEVTARVDGMYLRDANGVVITHRVLYASGTEMNFVPCYVKTGSAASEVPLVDWACAVQAR
jgi:hypothetical protein